jgi:uncharacterized membrane protein
MLCTIALRNSMNKHTRGLVGGHICPNNITQLYQLVFIVTILACMVHVFVAYTQTRLASNRAYNTHSHPKLRIAGHVVALHIP